jgi:hypothetical protein
MTNLTKKMSRVTLIVAGIALALFVGATGCQKPSAPQPQPVPKVIDQVPGDPPVTIGDGSLHAHSGLDWVTPDLNNHMIIQPWGDSQARTGTFYPGGECANITPSNPNGYTPNASAFLWTDDDNFYDISPQASSWTVTIAHDHRTDATNKHLGPNVTVTFVSNQLLIATDQGSFEAAKGGKNDGFNRHHNMPDVVTSIKVSGASSNFTWKPSSPKHPHYTLGFCYH